MKNEYKISNLGKLGITKFDKIESFINNLLFRKNIKYYYQLKDQKDYLLKVSSTRLKTNKEFIIPDDLYKINLEKDSFKIIDSLKMSSSFPFIYQPFRINNEYFLDGGIKRNINLELFNDRKEVKIAFKLVKKANYEIEFFNNVIIVNLIVNIKTFNFELTKSDILNLLTHSYNLIIRNLERIRQYFV